MNDIIIDIIRITSEGKGIGFAPDGRTVIVDGVKEDDQRVKVRVLEEKEVTIIAKKISISTSVKKEEPDTKLKKNDNPYELDGGSDEEEDDDNDYYDD